MQPKHPVIWVIGFAVTLFLLRHFWLNPDSTLAGSALFAAVVSLLTLGALYGGEKLRRKWFAPDAN